MHMSRLATGVSCKQGFLCIISVAEAAHRGSKEALVLCVAPLPVRRPFVWTGPAHTTSSDREGKIWPYIMALMMAQTICSIAPS